MRKKKYARDKVSEEAQCRPYELFSRIKECNGNAVEEVLDSEGRKNAADWDVLVSQQETSAQLCRSDC